MSHISTDDRGAAIRERKERAFRRTFAATTTTLLILCAVFLGLGYFQGVKLSTGQIDTTKAVAQPGQQLRLFANQSIAKVTAKQVTVTPAARFTVSSQGAAVAVQFADRLDYDTGYTVSISGVTSLYQPQRSTFRYAFTTAPAGLFYLHRARPNEGEQVDRIYQTGLKGIRQKAIYSAPHIQEFAVFPTALAVVTLNDDKTSSLSLVSMKDAAVEHILLPAAGSIQNLRSDSEAALLGFSFTSGDGGPGSEYSNTLMTVNFNSTHTVEPVLGLDGKPLDVLNWLFLPGTTSIVAQAEDESLLLIDAAKSATPVPLGRYSGLAGSSPDGKSLVVSDAFGNLIYSLASGKGKRLPPLPIDGAMPFGGDLELTGSGTARVQKVALYNEATARFDISVVLEDDKGSRLLFASPNGTDSIDKTFLSPNSQFVAIEQTLDPASSVSDGYFRNARSRNVATVIVDVSTGKVVRHLDGFAVAWQ
jgi:hypothetical protein